MDTEKAINEFSEAIKLASAKLIFDLGNQAIQIVEDQKKINQIILFRNAIMFEYLKGNGLFKEFNEYFLQRSKEIDKKDVDEFIVNSYLDIINPDKK